MKNFLDRFKPENAKKSNPLANFRLGGQTSFSGQGQSLGGSQPGQVIPIQLSEPGPLGVGVEKRPNSKNTAIVNKVVDGSQAARAGLQRGDVLCFAGSNGQEEILYEMFLELARSEQRPLCFEVRRLTTKADALQKPSSADAYNRKQAMIAAAEAREKAHKQKSKPVSKISTGDRLRGDKKDVKTYDNAASEVPKSAEALAAIEAAKTGEASTAAELGYNPYEINRVTAGQARTATVASTHGKVGDATKTGEAPLPAVRPPTDALEAAEEPVSDDFQHAFETLVTAHDSSTVKSSIGIIRKLIANATTKGQAEGDDSAKFRRVRLANAKIKAAIVDVDGGVDIMLAVGFQLLEEDGESVLVYPPAHKGPVWLDAALSKLERYEKS